MFAAFAGLTASGVSFWAVWSRLTSTTRETWIDADAAVAATTVAAVHQGALDYEQCERVWGSAWEGRIADWFALHGVPAAIAEDLHAQGEAVRPLIRYAPEPERLHAGDRVDGWEVGAFPG